MVKIVTITIKFLDTIIPAICNIHIAGTIYINTVWSTKLAISIPLLLAGYRRDQIQALIQSCVQPFALSYQIIDDLYDIEVDAAPVVIAKGQDLIALKIREVAENNGVSVVEDKTLARPLYQSVEVDQIIPTEFYEAVAQIIIFLNRK